MKKTILFLCILVANTMMNAQTFLPSYQDGKIWLRIDKEYVPTVSLDREDTRNLPLNTLPFVQILALKYQITQLSKPFFAAKESESLQRTYLIRFKDFSNVNNIIRDIENAGNVDYAEKVPLDKPCLTPNDPGLGSQWHLSKINATGAWNYFSAGSTIVVGIVDDAMDRNHPDLSPSLWVNAGDNNSNGIDDDGNGYIDDKNGFDVADNDNNPNPTTSAYNHGTHVSGIACAATNNNTGVSSIGFSTKLMCVKSTNSPSSITDGYDGIVYAAANGAKVINLSWGGYSGSTTAQNIINWAYTTKGCIIIAAAGNDGVATVHYPAGYNNVVSVAASNSNDTKASFSNYGTWIDITAPGNNIYSTLISNSYGNFSGTSMSSPLVAGLCALMKSLNPGLTQTDIINCLKNSAVNINSLNPSYSGKLGSGRIDAAAAMNCVSATLNWAPLADFVANTRTVTAGGQVSFTDLSVYNPTSWSWKFPGGNLSTFSGKTPPPVTYTMVGVYSVSLTVSNANGSSSKSKSLYIKVEPAGGCTFVNYPVPTGWTLASYVAGTGGANGFVNGNNSYADKEKGMYFNTSASPYTYITGVSIGFLKASKSPGKSVGIKVYDGTSGSPGTQLGTTYTVSMSYIRTQYLAGKYVDVTFYTPIALPASKKYFVTVDVTGLTWPTDSLSLASNSDGQTTPAAIWDKKSDNIWRQYATSGTWNLSASLYMHPLITDKPAIANYTQNTYTICPGQSIAYDATGSTFEDTLLWVFAGGSPYLSSYVKDTVIYNTAGTYKTILYVVGGGCHQLDSLATIVTVKPKPSINVGSAGNTICSGNSVSLTAGGTSSSYVWSPSNGLSKTIGTNVSASPSSTTTYNIAGILNGCSNNANITITVQNNPIVNASVSNTMVCTGNTLGFDASLSTDVTTYAWTFPGGSPATANTSNGSVGFSTPGTLTVTLAGSNSCGTGFFSKKITVGLGPNLVVSISSATICPGNSVNYDASTSTNTSSYNWNMPGGSPSSDVNISGSTSFANAGTYTLTLGGTNSCGTVYNTNYITVLAPPVVNASVSNTLICTGGSVTYNASASAGVAAYNWIFTGGSPASGNTATGSVSFANVGTYTLNLSGSNNCGTGTYSQKVQVNPAVSLNATLSTATICAGSPVTYDASSSSNVSTYAWIFPGGSPVNSITSGGSVSFAAAGTRTLTLTGSNSCSSGTFKLKLTIYSCTGMDEQEKPSASIYSDASSQKIIVKLNTIALTNQTQFIFTNLLGQQLLSQKLSGPIESIDVSGFAKGVYMVGILNGTDIVQTAKVVVW